MTRLTIDDLEVLTPDQLGKLLLAEVWESSPDVQFIQDILDVGCPINIVDKTGWTALHRAAWNGHLEVVEILVSRGAQLDVMNPWGWTAWDSADDIVRKSCPELKP